MKVKNINEIYGASFDSIDEMSVSDDDDEPLIDRSDFSKASATHNDYLDTMDEEDMSYRLHKAFENLSEREATILKMYSGTFGYSHPYKDKEIAQELDLTPERVRQLRHSAKNKLALSYR